MSRRSSGIAMCVGLWLYCSLPGLPGPGCAVVECETNRDCGNGEKCQHGVCQTDDGGSSPTLSYPAGDCLAAAPCQSDIDCVPLGGYRCNIALSPPECEKLYCGAEHSFCSTSEACEPPMHCFEDGCTHCDKCGNLCKVDFATDPLHCGGCNQPVGATQPCVDGQPACPADRMACGNICVDLSSDSAHCGACDTPVPAPQVCINGQPGCMAPESVCGSHCVNLKEDVLNCNACGRECPKSPWGVTKCGDKDEQCIDGLCHACVYTEDPDATCAITCSKLGLSCEKAQARCQGFYRTTDCNTTFEEGYEPYVCEAKGGEAMGLDCYCKES